MKNGQLIQCPRLFDRLAIDWLGRSTAAYRKLSVALVLHALKPDHSRFMSVDEVAKKSPVEVGELSGALERTRGYSNPPKSAINVIEIGDI